MNGGSIRSELTNVLRSKPDWAAALEQLHHEVEQLEIMWTRTCLYLLDLATMGDMVRTNSLDSTEEVTVSGLQSLGVEIEGAKASILELRREILEAKRERIEVLDGLDDGFLESRPATRKHKGSRSIVVVAGIAALVMALSVVGVCARGDNSRRC